MSSSYVSQVKKDAERRVLVLGIDGATFNIIEPMAQNGRLPNLARLMKEGACGVLRSTLPPVTIPAWISMMTGKNPGKLGLFDLLKRDGYSVQPNSYCFREHNPVWRLLNRYGIKTGMMNIPGTYPPEEVAGFMVTGMMTPSKRSSFSYPATLGSELDTTVSDYEIDVPQWQYFDEGIFIKDIYKVMKKRGRAAEYLIRHIPCEFYMIVFTSSDRLHHFLWDKRDVLEAYWEELDQVLGEIITLFGEDTTVFIVSDHGFGPLERTFYVNEWLRRKKFLRVRRKFNEKTLVKLGRFIERLYRFLGDRKLVRPIGRFLNEAVGIDRLQKYTYAYLSHERLERRVNWRRTKAFSCVHTPHFGQIYLNKEGQMKKGCVSEEEEEELRDAIIRELTNLTDPRTDEKVHIEVYKADDIYVGPHVGEAPDIVFLLDDGRCEVDAKVGEDKLFVEGAPLTGWKGTHTTDGVFIACGPGIKRGYNVEKASIIDIAPTILRAFGIPPQDDMDGRVLDEIFEEDATLPEREVLDISSGAKEEEAYLDDTEKALIEDRLRKLGYIS